MEQHTPTPPRPQIKDEAAGRAKTRHFPIFDFGGGGGGQGFLFILSKIVGRCTTFLVKRSFICMRMKNDFHIKG